MNQVKKKTAIQTDYQAKSTVNTVWDEPRHLVSEYNNLVVSTEHWETGTGASLLSTQQVEQTSVQSGRKELCEKKEQIHSNSQSKSLS